MVWYGKGSKHSTGLGTGTFMIKNCRNILQWRCFLSPHLCFNTVWIWYFNSLDKFFQQIHILHPFIINYMSGMLYTQFTWLSTCGYNVSTRVDLHKVLVLLVCTNYQQEYQGSEGYWNWVSVCGNFHAIPGRQGCILQKLYELILLLKACDPIKSQRWNMQGQAGQLSRVVLKYN